MKGSILILIESKKILDCKISVTKRKYQLVFNVLQMCVYKAKQ